jgi:TRAP-type mannitol/chloroaromatic compound transport system substrate-binding protein
MKRNRTIVGACVLVLAVLVLVAFPQPAAAQGKTFQWKVQTAWPPTDTAYDAAKILVGMIERMSGGRLKMELLPAGAIVPPFEIQEAVHKGVIDAGHTTPGYIVGKVPAFVPLTHGPMLGMDFIDYFGWYWEGGGHELLQEAYKEKLRFNVISFQHHPEGPQAMGWFKKEIHSFADIKGLKYRIYGIGNEAYGKLGIAAMTIPGGEIVPALERGVLDGAEWQGCHADKILGIDKIAKYHYAPGMHEPMTVGEFIINEKRYNDLPADLREIIKVATQASYWVHFVRWQIQTEKACQELLKEGIKIIKTSDELNSKFLEVYDKISAEKMAKDPFWAKVIESQKAYAGKMVPYRLSYWPDYNFIARHYWKDKIWLK